MPGGGLAGTASGKESERPALLGRQAAETHEKAAADQVRRVEQLCGDCEWGARSNALAVTRPTVWGEGAVYRLVHESAKDSTAAGPGAGTADCVDRWETVTQNPPVARASIPRFLVPESGRAKEPWAYTCSKCQ